MTDSKTQKVLSKVRKLLAMAEHDRSDENEAANAARMAEALLRKHNLTMTDITPEEAKSDVRETKFDKMKWTAGKAPSWVQGLIISIAEAHDCVVVWRRADCNDAHVAKAQSNLTFVGAEADTLVAKEVFQYLYSAVNRLTDEHFKTAYIPQGKARTYKNSFRDGMAARFNERFREMKAEKKAEFEAAAQTGTSLVVVKRDAIDAFLGHSTNYGSSKRQSSCNNEAYAAGHRKGSDVSFNKQMS